ncbi:hypothetical protein HU200_002104 [Digitaria exilis]|uniref:Uncharacterized protein n=1 Tax=Digitaria exilis TaxID=1010633 RepID=A0A835FX88_9POAL|nr:hypothetical protein HU200_002104 [Digitaria exilis]CAB3451113.1 unnamed protein product [Digitaria exilis]
MVENTHGSGRHAFGDLTNILCKRPALSDPEKSTGEIKIRRIEKDTVTRKGSDENAINSNKGKGVVFGNLFDGVVKENFEMPSIFRRTKVPHMAAKAADLLSKEVSDLRDRTASIDLLDLSDQEQDSSIDSEGEYDEDDSEMTGESLGHFSSSELANKTATNDCECLAQEEIVGSSGNQKPLSSLDFMTGGNMPSSSVQHASMRTVGSKAVPTKSCVCSFCLKAAFMWTDLHYKDARSRLSVLKKSIKFTRSLEAKQSKENEHAANVAGYNSKRSVGMEFELSQQQRSLFLYTKNALFRESTQLHSSFVKLKELRKNCKTDLEMIGNSSLGK